MPYIAISQFHNILSTQWIISAFSKYITQGLTYEMIFLKLFCKIALQWRFTGCTLYSSLYKLPFHRLESNFVLVKIYCSNDAGTMTSYIIEGFVHTYWRSEIIGLCGWPSNKSSHRLSIKVHPLQFDIPTLWPFQSPSLSPNNSDQGEIWKSWIPLPTHGLVIFQDLW